MSTLPAVSGLRILHKADWQSRAAAHRERAEGWTQPYRARRAQGKMHPIYDFLFIYYRFAPAQLEAWHPGFGVLLEGAELESPYSDKYYSPTGGGLTLDPAKLDAKLQKRLLWSLHLLEATQARPPQFNCYGMHEWAMVYQGGPEGRPRHEGTLPLRLGQAGTDRVVESQPICCSHFDAFRFFTESAMPLNKMQPTQDRRMQNEQPGCLHSNMDLYKWAAKCAPWLSSDLVWEAYEFAIQCREVDMRASPYDCTELGYEPIKIETPPGRIEYMQAQHELAAAANPIRQKIIEALHHVLAQAEGDQTES